MGRILENQTNNDNSDPANYPRGRVKNDSGVGDGTPVTEKVHGDMHQFFAKMASDGGVTLNDLPENVANGFQLNEAMELAIERNRWTGSGVVIDDGDITETSAVQYKITENRIELRGYLTKSTGTYGTILTLPVAARPSNAQVRPFVVGKSGGGSTELGEMRINSSGEILLFGFTSATSDVFQLDGIVMYKF